MITKIYSDNTAIIRIPYDFYPYNSFAVRLANACNEYIIIAPINKECEKILATATIDVTNIPDGSYDVFVYNYDGVAIDVSQNNLYFQTQLFINRKPCLIQ